MSQEKKLTMTVWQFLKFYSQFYSIVKSFGYWGSKAKMWLKNFLYDSSPLVINKSVAFFIVGLINFIFPTYQSSDYICLLFFSHDLFYVSCIPGLISFFISVAVIIYLSIIYTHYNSIHPQNPSPMLGQQGREGFIHKKSCEFSQLLSEPIGWALHSGILPPK